MWIINFLINSLTLIISLARVGRRVKSFSFITSIRTIMEIALIIGRIIYGGFFIMMGMNHFMKFRFLTQYAKNKRVPAAPFAVIVGGVLLLFGGVGILLGVSVRLAASGLVLFLFPTALIMHNFWAVPEDQKMNEMQHFMKDTALGSSALIVAALADHIPPLF